jgi:DNA helicase-2/ATP-dependent DNA helicase PcrA
MATGSDDQIEEERRLFYVALTRARDFLEVCMPLRYYAKKWSTSDRHSYAQLTRFLPDSILHHFERVNLEPPKVELEVSSSTSSTDIRNKIAAMWS